MMADKSIIGIYTALQPGSLMSGHSGIAVKPGKGIVGDRYYSDTGKNRSTYRGQPDFEITLIESEVIEEFNHDFGHHFHESDFRRNLVTKGVCLNEFEGRTFHVNGVKMFGVRLCEPCASLQDRLAVKILPELIGKGGLRAQILDAGIIRVGDHFER
jgi:MOSC domain-containing protein YiiM